MADERKALHVRVLFQIRDSYDQHNIHEALEYEVLTAAIDALERESRIEEDDNTYKSIPPKIVGSITGTFVDAQSTPVDLEPVRKLIKAAESLTTTMRIEEQPHTVVDVCTEARAALPALRYLLSEIEYVNSESVKAHFKELNDDWIEMKAEVENLRQKVHALKTMSTVEMMCENERVNQHVTEWEKRCLKAEAEVDDLREQLTQSHFGNTLLETEIEQLRKEITRLHEAKDLAVSGENEACARVALGSQISDTSLSAQWGRECAAAIWRRTKR